MILRIFATDGFTPERIFRWSVEETAAHLCAQQVLWVTHLNAPGWKGLVDWFVKQPCCRAVVLDTADRWDWNLEHEVTWRIAQGLYFQEEEKIEAVCWLHDDMAPPECQGFKDYLSEWLVSSSTAIESPCYQLWDSHPSSDLQSPLVLDQVRADKTGISFAADLHCWLAKWGPTLRWMRPAGYPSLPGDSPDRFRPLDAEKVSVSPWPFRHAKGVDRDFREGNGFDRRGFPKDRWRNADGVKCVPYNPETTWEDFRKGITP